MRGAETRNRGRRGLRRSAGFTFLELVVILALLSVLISIGVPRLEGLVPKYRLRSAARTLGSNIEYVRVTAISRERWMGIRYVLTPRDQDEAPYYQIIPPAPDDDPHQPIEERELQSKQELPAGVHFRRVSLAGGSDVESGAMNILFSPAGDSGSHIVVLGGPGERVASLKLNCITGILDYSETDELAFEHFED